MSDYFNYDEITWPEIAELPRDTPLIIPLGTGWDKNRVCASLSNPSRIGFLPSFPYGWHGSGLEISETLLTEYINNLVLSLRDDGFTHVYTLVPQDTIKLTKPEFQISLNDQSRAQSALPLPSDTELGKVILIPIGHVEQHGYHLPLSVDCEGNGDINILPRLVITGHALWCKHTSFFVRRNNECRRKGLRGFLAWCDRCSCSARL